MINGNSLEFAPGSSKSKSTITDVISTLNSLWE